MTTNNSNGRSSSHNENTHRIDKANINIDVCHTAVATSNEASSGHIRFRKLFQRNKNNSNKNVHGRRCLSPSDYSSSSQKKSNSFDKKRYKKEDGIVVLQDDRPAMSSQHDTNHHYQQQQRQPSPQADDNRIENNGIRCRTLSPLSIHSSKLKNVNHDMRRHLSPASSTRDNNDGPSGEYLVNHTETNSTKKRRDYRKSNANNNSYSNLLSMLKRQSNNQEALPEVHKNNTKHRRRRHLSNLKRDTAVAKSRNLRYQSPSPLTPHSSSNNVHHQQEKKESTRIIRIPKKSDDVSELTSIIFAIPEDSGGYGNVVTSNGVQQPHQHDWRQDWWLGADELDLNGNIISIDESTKKKHFTKLVTCDSSFSNDSLPMKGKGSAIKRDNRSSNKNNVVYPEKIDGDDDGDDDCNISTSPVLLGENRKSSTSSEGTQQHHNDETRSSPPPDQEASQSQSIESHARNINHQTAHHDNDTDDDSTEIATDIFSNHNEIQKNNTDNKVAKSKHSLWPSLFASVPFDTESIFNNHHKHNNNNDDRTNNDDDFTWGSMLYSRDAVDFSYEIDSHVDENESVKDFDELLGTLKVVYNNNGTVQIDNHVDDVEEVRSTDQFVEVMEIDEIKTMRTLHTTTTANSDYNTYDYYNGDISIALEGNDEILYEDNDVKVVHNNNITTTATIGSNPVFEVVHIGHHQHKIMEDEQDGNHEIDEELESLLNLTGIDESTVLIPDQTDSVPKQSTGSTIYTTDNQKDAHKKLTKNSETSLTEELLKQIIAKESRLGIHEDVASLYVAAAEMLNKQDKYYEAIQYYQESLNILHIILEQLQKEAHSSSSSNNTKLVVTVCSIVIDMAKAYNCIGKIYLNKLGKCYYAMDNFQRSYELLINTQSDYSSNASSTTNTTSPTTSSTTTSTHPLAYRTLIYIGNVYYRVRNSLSTIRSANDPFHEHYKSNMLDLIANAHMYYGYYRMAIGFLEEKYVLLSTCYCSSNNKTSIGYSNILPSTSCSCTSGNKKEKTNVLLCLGFLSIRAGYYSEAIEYHDIAMRLIEKTSANEVNLARAHILKGKASFFLGEFDMSKILLHDALTILQGLVITNRKRKDNSNNNKSADVAVLNDVIAKTWRSLGIVQNELCEYEDAMKSFKLALTIQRKKLYKDMSSSYNSNSLSGDDGHSSLLLEHPEILLTRTEIAKVLSNQYELNEAMEEFQNILSTQTKVHCSKRHPNIADTYECIGTVYERLNNLPEAISNYEQCFFMREKFLGIDHPLVAKTLHHIATIRTREGKNGLALRILTNILSIRKETFGDIHIEVARAISSKGISLMAIGKVNEALECFNESVHIANELSKLSSKASATTCTDITNTNNDNYYRHPGIAEIHANIGLLHLRKCQYDEAQKHFNMSLETILSFNQLNDNHPMMIKAKQMLDRVESEELRFV